MVFLAPSDDVIYFYFNKITRQNLRLFSFLSHKTHMKLPHTFGLPWLPVEIFNLSTKLLNRVQNALVSQFCPMVVYIRIHSDSQLPSCSVFKTTGVLGIVLLFSNETGAKCPQRPKESSSFTRSLNDCPRNSLCMYVYMYVCNYVFHVSHKPLDSGHYRGRL